MPATRNIPTNEEKAALAGTGTPGSGDPYVSDSDSRMTDERVPIDGSVTFAKLETDLQDRVTLPLRNETGGPLAAGTIVTLDGYSDAEDRFLVAPADAGSGGLALYILRSAVANNANGVGYRADLVTGDTSLGVVGDGVYLGAGAGAGTWVLAPPAGDAYARVVGIIRTVAVAGLVEIRLDDTAEQIPTFGLRASVTDLLLTTDEDAALSGAVGGLPTGANPLVTEAGLASGEGNVVTPSALVFGDGVDGDLAGGAGATTLTRAMFYDDVTLNLGDTLDPRGFPIYVAGTLTFNGGTILANGDIGSGSNGGAGHAYVSGFGSSGGVGGDPPSGAASATGNVWSMGMGGGGGGGARDGGAGSGGVGGPAIGAIDATGAFRCGGGAGGAAGGNPGGFAGSTSPTRNALHSVLPMFTIVVSGGGGGGGGAVAAGAGVGDRGGGGGGGAGAVRVAARNVVITGAGGSIFAIGGNGADASSLVDAGGGGGGGGGLILLVRSTRTGVLATSVAGGAGGLAAGAGSAGTAGDAGLFVELVV